MISEIYSGCLGRRIRAPFGYAEKSFSAIYGRLL